MRWFTTCLAVTFTVAPFVSVAAAGERAYVITAHTARPSAQVTRYTVNGGNARTSPVTLVQRQVAEPAAVVSRELSQQPVHPHLIELKVAQTTTYIDPAKDYQFQNGNPIDQNHSILRAQRLHAALNAPGVVIVRNPRAAEVEDQMIRADEIQPRAILQLPPRPGQQPQKQDQPTPKPQRWKVASL